MNKIHLLIILFLICLGQSAQAQYYSVNYDKKTVAAMAAAYNTEAATEAYYNEQVQNILKHYNAAEVATAGIFASKFLKDMDGSRHDAQKSTNSPVLGQLSGEDM